MAHFAGPMISSTDGQSAKRCNCPAGHGLSGGVADAAEPVSIARRETGYGSGPKGAPGGGSATRLGGHEKWKKLRKGGDKSIESLTRVTLCRIGAFRDDPA